MMAAVLLVLNLGGAPCDRHVRTSEPKILALVNTGLARSATFRRVVATLDRSDVIVYLAPKLTTNALGGYLAHNVVSAGGHRYLRVAVDIHGADGNVVPIIAHELQHAIEVAQDDGARDPAGVDRLFRRLATAFGCGHSACSDTQAARDVENKVRAELKYDDALI